MPGGLSGIPEDGEDLVASLTGTGSRSLQAQLNIRCMRHFNMDAGIKFLVNSDHPWHVPVREPYEYFLSRVQQTRDYHDTEWISRTLRGMDLMISLTSDRADTTFYPTRSLTEHKGGRTKYANRWPGYAIRRLAAWMTPERAAFFLRWYL